MRAGVQTGGAFVPVTPYRLASSTVGAQGSLAVPVSGHGGVPTTGAAAAVLSVSAIGYAGRSLPAQTIAHGRLLDLAAVALTGA